MDSTGPSRKRRGAEDRGHGDLISRLPDGVLGAVVSLLDTAEGARTALLSRRWRHIWRSAPLNLDDRLQFMYSDDERLQVISQILDAHGAPARRVSFRSLRRPCNLSRYEQLFPLAIFDALEELCLHFPVAAGRPTLPASALRFAGLRVMDIGNCTFPDSGWAPAFPCLNCLSLCDVAITEEVLELLISNSPGIEALQLDSNSGHRRIRLSLPSLRYLAVLVRSFRKEHEVELDDLVIEDAAKLQRLLLHEVNYGPSVRITGATKLQMLGYLGTGFPVIQLGNSIFKGMVPFRLVDQFSTVTILALEMPDPKLKVLIGYLRCFPCLEKLHVKFSVNVWMDSKPTLRVGADMPIKCLDNSLKTVVLKSYAGLRAHINFAKFFVERARALNVMKLYCITECTHRWVQKQHTLLNIESRASRRARFRFLHKYDFPFSFWMDDGLSKADPFINRLRANVNFAKFFVERARAPNVMKFVYRLRGSFVFSRPSTMVNMLKYYVMADKEFK